MMSWLILIGAVLVSFMALWSVVPAPSIWLVAISILASELSPLWLAVTILIAAAAWRTGGNIRIVALLLCAVSAVIFTLPMWQFPSDASWSFRRLLTGLEAGATRITRGVAVNSGAVPLTVDVYQPQSQGRYPILVQIYGGAWQRGRPADDGKFAEHIASLGYVVFALDYRHAPESTWPAQLDDVHATLSWIRSHADQYDADASRIALVGRSAGGQLATEAAFRDPTIKGVISFYGPVDLARGWREPPSPDPIGSRPVLEALIGGTPDQQPDRYKDASPITHISAKAPPSLLIYGARDHIVQIKFGRALHQALTAAGASSRLVEIPWGDHAFDAIPGGLGGQLAVWHTERFLRETLLGPLDRGALPNR